MTGKQLAIVAVRLVGVVIGLHASVAGGQLIAGSTSVAWHPWSWWICLLISAWILAAFFMVAWPAYAARRIAVERPQPDQAADWDRRTVEGIGLRLLGLYVLVQAAAETAHIGFCQIAFQLRLRELAYVWVDPSPNGMLGVAGASIKTVAGAVLILGTQRVWDAIRWARTAGRDWDLDGSEKLITSELGAKEELERK